MNAVNYRVSLDMFDAISQTTIKAKKGDSACKIYITLSKNGKLFSIGEGCFATFNAKKSDGNFIYDNCTIEGDTIVYDFSSSFDENGVCQISAVEGNVDCEVTLYNADKEQLTSPRFTLYIDSVVYNGEEIASSPESDILKRLIKESKDLIENIKDGIDIPENVVDEAVKKYFKENPIQGIDGEDGFSYIPEVVQPSPDKFVLRFHAIRYGIEDESKMFAETITLPRGADGEDGYTPQKGVDYFTPADVSEMVNAVLEALPTYEGEVEEV